MLVTSLALIVGDYFMTGISFDSPSKAFFTALVLAILNIFLKPLMVFLTLPATIFTLGFFILIINAVILSIAGELVPGFYIANFWSAFLLALFISVVNTIFNARIHIHRNNGDEDFNP